MKKLSTLLSIPLMLLSVAAFSQATLVDVAVSNNQFNPAQVNIMVGDTVRWTNGIGSHNINGSLMSYPDNPEPFGFGPISSNWDYSHVFTVPGVYGYHCDLHQGMGMTGLVVVDEVTSINESLSNQFAVSAFPNPASDFVIFDLRKVPADLLTEAELVIYSAIGKRQQQLSLLNADQIEVNVSDLPGGLYLFQLINAERTLYTGRLIVQ